MDEELYASLKLVAFDYEPMGYMHCDGRPLQINQYQALYALLVNRFGGDGHTTFNIPKLDPPAKDLHWIICTQGLWPSRP
jgi:microcystin-dependent protein